MKKPRARSGETMGECGCAYQGCGSRLFSASPERGGVLVGLALGSGSGVSLVWRLHRALYVKGWR